ncbi:hypothetical protein B0H63DRAFT_518025 [Podospora didyma]|uniref:Uncharacterized protein n=1 Tax=Podospora didyma TaxID=330526 RepID=A0AAE0P8F4_9PEZI|nr:hypothetical protein B0H63DRAFT_518025 [Podospora didyma]
MDSNSLATAAGQPFPTWAIGTIAFVSVFVLAFVGYMLGLCVNDLRYRERRNSTSSSGSSESSISDMERGMEEIRKSPRRPARKSNRTSPEKTEQGGSGVIDTPPGQTLPPNRSGTPRYQNGGYTFEFNTPSSKV